MKKLTQLAESLKSITLTSPNLLQTKKGHIKQLIESLSPLEISQSPLPVLKIFQLAAQYPGWAQEILPTLNNKLNVAVTLDERFFHSWETSYWRVRSHIAHDLVLDSSQIDEFVLAVNEKDYLTSMQLIQISQMYAIKKNPLPPYLTLYRSMSQLICENISSLQIADFVEVLGNLTKADPRFYQPSQPELGQRLESYIKTRIQQFSGEEINQIFAALNHTTLFKSDQVPHLYRLVGNMKSYINIKTTVQYPQRTGNLNFLDNMLPQIACHKDWLLLRTVQDNDKSQQYLYFQKISRLESEGCIFNNKKPIKISSTQEVLESLKAILPFKYETGLAKLVSPFNEVVKPTDSPGDVVDILYLLSKNNILCDLQDNPNVKTQLLQILNNPRILMKLQQAQVLNLAKYMFRTMPHHQKILASHLARLDAFIKMKNFVPTKYDSTFLRDFCISKTNVKEMPYLSEGLWTRIYKMHNNQIPPEDLLHVSKLKFYRSGKVEDFDSFKYINKGKRGQHSRLEKLIAAAFMKLGSHIQVKLNESHKGFEIDAVLSSKRNPNRMVCVDVHGRMHYYHNSKEVMNPASASKKQLLESLGEEYYIVQYFEQTFPELVQKIAQSCFGKENSRSANNLEDGKETRKPLSRSLSPFKKSH